VRCRASSLAMASPSKKAYRQQSASEPTWLAYAGAGCASKAFFLDPADLVFIDEIAITTNMLRLNGWSPRGERLISDAPMGHCETVTFIAGLRQTRIVASTACEQFASEVQQRHAAAAVSPTGIDRTAKPRATSTKMASCPRDRHPLLNRFAFGICRASVLKN